MPSKVRAIGKIMRSYAIFLIASCALSMGASAKDATTQSCLVVGIADGDTLTARCGTPGKYEQVKVRLAGIDAPEKAQPFGTASRQRLSDLCFQQQATITTHSKDRYGRTVGDVECKGQDVGETQVKAGMAWVYTQYAKGYTRLPPLQVDARAGKIGLWADKAPVPPWEFRRPSKAGGAPPVTRSAGAAQDGTCHTGPRGGTYTIINGRKNYGGC